MSSVGIPLSSQRQSRSPASAFSIAVFIAVLVSCIFALNYAINTGLRQLRTGSFGVTNRILRGDINADILITGSSRALTHYDPAILQNATGRDTYNIGINGSHTDLQLAMLKTYLRYNRNPSLVIHNLDLFSFVTTKDIYEPARYLPYLNEPDLYNALRQITPDAWKCRFIPLYGYAVLDLRFTWVLGLKGLLGWNPPEYLRSGFEPRDTDWTGDFERFKASNPMGVRFEIEPEGIKCLEELVETCRSRHIPLILVYSPVYAEMKALENNRDEVFTEFRRICSRSGVILWDYSDSSITRDKSLFYNSQHLNVDGAEAFSKDLALRITQEQPLSPSLHREK